MVPDEIVDVCQGDIYQSATVVCEEVDDLLIVVEVGIALVDAGIGISDGPRPLNRLRICLGHFDDVTSCKGEV